MALCLHGSVVQEPVRRWPDLWLTAREAQRAGAQGEHGLWGQFLSGYLTLSFREQRSSTMWLMCCITCLFRLALVHTHRAIGMRLGKTKFNVVKRVRCVRVLHCFPQFHSV